MILSASSFGVTAGKRGVYETIQLFKHWYGQSYLCWFFCHNNVQIEICSAGLLALMQFYCLPTEKRVKKNRCGRFDVVRGHVSPRQNVAKRFFKRKQGCVEHHVVFMQALQVQPWGTAVLIRRGLYTCPSDWVTTLHMKRQKTYFKACCTPLLHVSQVTTKTTWS